MQLHPPCCASCVLQPTVTSELQHRQGGKSLKITISSESKKTNRWGGDSEGHRESTEPERSRVVQSAGSLQDPGGGSGAGMEPQKAAPWGAGHTERGGVHRSPLPPHHHCALPAGLEGWAAAAVGAVAVPLRWADGEVSTEWDGEEPLDFLAPGTCWAPGVLLCCWPPPRCSRETTHC